MAKFEIVRVLEEYEATGGASLDQLFLPKTRKVCERVAVGGSKSPSSINSFSLAVICIFICIICCAKADNSDLVSKSILQNSTKVLNMSSPDIAFRLLKDIKPLKYDIYLHPDLNNGTFQGRISILIDVLSKQNLITLHQKNLKISVDSLKYHGKEANLEKEINESYPNDEHEVFIVKPKEDLSVGQYDLNLTFSGVLKDKIIGFYSSKYKDANNKTRVIATSKFEPTYARQSFPCFDEPNFKAEFSVKLVHPSGDGYSALSNMNVESTAVDQPSAGLTTVTFAKSVPMSTYIACFVVSDFVSVTRQAKGLEGRTFPVSVYTTAAQKEKGTFALDVGVKVLEYYIKLFGIDYPLPKLDMAAIPDFVSGALENWGLVTYRESRLLYDEKTSSTANKQDIVQVVAHEFAHMWFGNLVTMKWWNDLWLNEGFAVFVEFKGSDAVFPEWNVMDHFLIDVLHSALEFDAKLSSHPIVQTVSNPDEITAIFDLISYDKGASVLRMLENFVGTDVFFDGISKYLKKYKYGNAETVELFDILQESVGKRVNVNAIMDTWTRQMGFPVVSVKKDKLTYTLTQKRFLANSKATFDASESPFGYKWTIPVTYVTSKNSTPTFIWFDKDASDLSIKLDEPVDWIKFNVDQVGYYRVNYEPSEWDVLLHILRKNHTQLSTRDRTHLLEDAFALANAGELDYSVAMHMTLYLDNEKSYPPWYVAANKLKAVNALLLSTETSDKLRDYVQKLVNKVYHEVTWKVERNKDVNVPHLRTSVLDLACSVGHTECLEQAGAIFKAWINDAKDERPHADIRSNVYYYGMMHAGGEAEWEVMFKRFASESDASEKNKLMRGLAGIRSSHVLKKYINLAMDENYVRSQDTLTCLILISRNSEGTQLVWDWLRENWQLLIDRYTLNDRRLGTLVPNITKNFASQAKLDEINDFFKKYPDAGAGASGRKQAIETVQTNIKWLEDNKAKIDRWLDSQAHLSLAN